MIRVLIAEDMHLIRGPLVAGWSRTSMSSPSWTAATRSSSRSVIAVTRLNSTSMRSSRRAT